MSTQTFFEKFARTFAFLPVNTRQEPNGNCSIKWFRWTFYFWVDFFGWIFLLWYWIDTYKPIVVVACNCVSQHDQGIRCMDWNGLPTSFMWFQGERSVKSANCWTNNGEDPGDHNHQDFPKSTAIEIGGVLQYKWEAHWDTNGGSADSISLSSEHRAPKVLQYTNWRRIAIQTGGVLRYFFDQVVVAGVSDILPKQITKIGRREKTPTPKTRFSTWTLLRTPGRFTTRPLLVHFTTKMSVVRPFSVLSKDEIGP